MYAKCNVCYVVQENKDLHYITLIIIHSAPDKTLQNKDLTNTEKTKLKTSELMPNCERRKQFSAWHTSVSIFLCS